MEGKKIITIASRKSKLALYQSEFIMKKLQEQHPNFTFQIETFSTKGDRILDVSLNKIGDKGLFTKELEVALLDKRADIAVHSLKDMPTDLPEHLMIGAISEREDPTDAVVLHSKHKGKSISDLPDGSLIGTSSLRRVAQLQRIFPKFQFRSIRGNLQTRLQKLDDYENFHFDAIILASAGLIRMGLEERIAEKLSPDFCLPAVGQGALAIECRENDEFILNVLQAVNHIPTEICCTAERMFMKTLKGGCQVPIGVFTEAIERDGKVFISLRGMVLNIDGSKCVEATLESEEYNILSSKQLGNQLAEDLLAKGAKEILNKIYNR